MSINFRLSQLAKRLATINQGKILQISSTGEAAVTDIPAAPTEVPAGAVMYFSRSTAPSGYLKANGAAVLISSYPGLLDIYCGDASNATAVFGYKCTNPANPNGSRSTAGTYITVPDLRGEFIRGWDDGRTVDNGRGFGTYQANDYASHSHGVSDPTHAHSVYDPGHWHYQTTSGMDNGNSGYEGNYPSGCNNPVSQRQSPYGTYGAGTGIGIYGAGTGVSINYSGGTETRPRNISMLACIKY